LFKRVAYQSSKILSDFFSAKKFTVLFDDSVDNVVLVEYKNNKFLLNQLEDLKINENGDEYEYTFNDLSLILADLEIGFNMPSWDKINSYQFDNMSELNKVKMMKGLLV
jgi:hypothetical protein